MEFKELVARARTIRKAYTKLEQSRLGRSWSSEEILLGYVKDVGDLAELVQAKEGIRDVENISVKLAHELNDCFWSIIVLADYNSNEQGKGHAKDNHIQPY